MSKILITIEKYKESENTYVSLNCDKEMSKVCKYLNLEQLVSQIQKDVIFYK